MLLLPSVDQQHADNHRATNDLPAGFGHLRQRRAYSTAAQSSWCCAHIPAAAPQDIGRRQYRRHICANPWQNIAQASLAQFGAREGGWLQRDGLGRPGLVLPDHALRDRPFLDWKQRLARLPVEHENIAVFGDLRDRIDALATVHYSNQIGLGRHVSVPQVVVHNLVVPDALTGADIEGDDAVGKEILS